MTLLNRRSAYALGFCALTTRIFIAIAIDLPSTLNAGYLCVPAACAANLPSALLMWGLWRSSPYAAPAQRLDQACGRNARRALCMLLCIMSVYDTASVARLAATSVEYAAYKTFPVTHLSVIAILGAGLICLTGGAGVSNASRIWFVITGILLGIVFVFQIPHIKVSWLFPLLGPGLSELIPGAHSLSGAITPLISLWLCLEQEKGQDRQGGAPYRPTGAGAIVKLLLFSSLCAALLLMIYSMLVPALPHVNTYRSFYLDRVLTNGHLSIALQLPMLLMWFLCLTALMAFNVLMAALMLKGAFEKIPYAVALGIVIIAALPMVFWDYSDRAALNIINMARYWAVTLPFILLCVVGLIRLGRNDTREKV